MAGIFGPSGLTSCTDDISYDEVLRQLRRDTLPAVPRELQSYFTDKLEPLLKFNVDASCGQWTNNACESINHVLKQRQQWKRHMLPDLVENLRSLISSQYAEADRAICGRGNYALRPSHQRHRLAVADWRAMTEPQRQRARNAVFCLSHDVVAGTTLSTSSDGNLTVLHRPVAGKKLGSRRRPRADRTNTPAKRRKL